MVLMASSSSLPYAMIWELFKLMEGQLRGEEEEIARTMMYHVVEGARVG